MRGWVGGEGVEAWRRRGKRVGLGWKMKDGDRGSGWGDWLMNVKRVMMYGGMCGCAVVIVMWTGVKK